MATYEPLFSTGKVGQPPAEEKTIIRKVEPKVEELPFYVKEAINILRGNIQLSGYELKLISVTSAVPDEGKSSISFHLAQSFASLGKKTLFIDCDIRKSVIRERYNITGYTEGLTEFLCGKRTIADVLCHTENDALDMIFTGAQAPNPSELISGQRFERLCQWSKQKYDYVILDTPPVNEVIDSTLVSKLCDGTVLVVVSGQTERAQAIRAKRQLEYANVRLLGTVLNKVGAQKGGYGYYGYGYGYGHGYGYYRKDEQQDSEKRGKRR